MRSILVNRIDALARSRLATVSADALLLDAARLLSDRHISLVIVCDSHGVMVGVITKTNIVPKRDDVRPVINVLPIRRHSPRKVQQQLARSPL